MKQKTWIILLAVVAAVLIIAAVFLWIGVIKGGLPALFPEKPQAQTAPDVTVYTADGTAVKLSDFKGKPVVLNFWASWCGPCKSEMPAFEAAYQAQGDDIQFLMVNLTDGVSETVETASAFIAGTGYTFPVFYDTSAAANQAYDVSAIPATFFIDADGCIIDSHTGALDAATLENYLDKIA